MASELPAHDLVAAKESESLTIRAAPENPPASLGDDRYLCTYDEANWWSADWENAAGTWARNAAGRYDHYGSLDLRNTGILGSFSRATYSAEVGHALVFNGDGFVRAKVGFPWSYKGDIDLLSQFSPAMAGFSRSTIDMRFLVDVMRDDSSSALEVDGFTVTANRGVPGDFDDVSNNGFDTRTVSVVGFGELLRSAYRVEAELETETEPVTNARAAFDFTEGDGRGWLTGPTQRWTITMKPGFVLVDCG